MTITYPNWTLVEFLYRKALNGIGSSSIVVEALVIFSSNKLHPGSSWQILLTGFMFNSWMNFFDRPHEVFFREKYNYNLLSNPVPNQNLIIENEIRKWENISNMILNFLYTSNYFT